MQPLRLCDQFTAPEPSTQGQLAENLKGCFGIPGLSRERLVLTFVGDWTWHVAEIHDRQLTGVELASRYAACRQRLQRVWN